jgi:hypothetical protein
MVEGSQEKEHKGTLASSGAYFRHSMDSTRDKTKIGSNSEGIL